MKLEDFHRMVSAEVKRGTALDGLIPLYTKQSVNFLERNWPLKYMEEWVTISLAPGEQLVDMIWSFRNFKFLRRSQSSAWLYLNKEDPRDENVPGLLDDGNQLALRAYSQIGVRYLRFNAKWNGTAACEIEGIIYKFSDWQSTKPDYRSFLLENGSDLLLYQTMMRIGLAIRDPRLPELYRPSRDEALHTFLNMDQDAEFEGREADMEYGGIYK